MIVGHSYRINHNQKYDRNFINENIKSILEDSKTKTLLSFEHFPDKNDLIEKVGTLIFVESKSYAMYYLVLENPGKTKYKVLGSEDATKKGYNTINRLFKVTLKNIRSYNFSFNSK